MSLRIPFALLAITIGVIGLALNMYVIGGTMWPSPEQPIPRGEPRATVA